MKMKRELADLSPSERQVYEDIESHGWHVVKVNEGDETAGWAFSIGLHVTLRHPEVVLFGLPGDVMHAVINSIGENVRSGSCYENGQFYGDLLEGYQCRFQRVSRKWYRPFLGYATWYYGGAQFPVLQCVWPDKDGRWPGDPASEVDWSRLQPLLSRADAQMAGAAAWLESLGLPIEGAG
jgi:Domain of unknown function (DUF4262)